MTSFYQVTISVETVTINDDSYQFRIDARWSSADKRREYIVSIDNPASGRAITIHDDLRSLARAERARGYQVRRFRNYCAGVATPPADAARYAHITHDQYSQF